MQKNSDQPRPQTKKGALTKSVAFITVFILFLVLVSQVGLLLRGGAMPGLFYGIGGTVGSFITAFLFVRSEKRPLASIGLRWEKGTLPRFVYGILIGTGLFFFVIAVICFSAGIRIQASGTVNHTAILLNLVPVFFLALMEEVGFRTLPLVKLEKSYGILTTQFILALLFAFYHMLNGWGIAISFMGPFIWSFVFVLAASWSGGIAMSTGIHFSLNVMQALAGLKGGAALFHLIEKKETAAPLLPAQTAGILAHGLVLLGALWLTGWYKRNRKKAMG